MVKSGGLWERRTISGFVESQNLGKRMLESEEGQEREDGEW